MGDVDEIGLLFVVALESFQFVRIGEQLCPKLYSFLYYKNIVTSAITTIPMTIRTFFATDSQSTLWNHDSSSSVIGFTREREKDLDDLDDFLDMQDGD